MSCWLLAVAMEPEARLLIPLLEPAPALGRKPCFSGRLAGRQVHLLLTGLGLVNAAQAVAAACERLAGLTAIINLGCAGAYAGSGLKVGDAALANEAVLADSGLLTSQAWHPLERLGLPLLRDSQGRDHYHRWPCDPALNDLFAGARPGIRRGVFATVSQVSGDPATAAVMEQRWGALLEDMESAAVAQVAALYGLPCACLRGVSNIAGQRELDVAAGAGAAQEVLLALDIEAIYLSSACLTGGHRDK
ncbi:MAG: futalosine hydrolase [Desulfarculus sp.]|nr:futalosine hydrolase [Desulfarculus sp.]